MNETERKNNERILRKSQNLFNILNIRVKGGEMKIAENPIKI
jgi:hypothetical protein